MEVRSSNPGYLHPDVVADRNKQGRLAENEFGTPDPDVAAAGPPKYFRTYEQVKTALFELQKAHPDLVQIEDIGDSGEKKAGKADRDIFAVHLTNHAAKGDKPKVMYIAGQHAREIANPELMMRFIQTAVDGYGKDAELTALLNTRQIDIVPMVNPDGHAVVEQGYVKNNSGMLWQRKNTSPPGGVDTNRNFDFKWGDNKGSSGNPNSDTYRGPAAASESEIQAVQNYAKASKPAAFIDWHSYSRLNLYPWGYTREKAPDEPGLKALAHKFSSWNKYTPEPGIDLYQTNGSSKDWGYGGAGAAAFTIETGDTFHQNDKQFDESWNLNNPIMSYLAKVADNPYARVQGPDVSTVAVTAAADGTRQLAAQANDTNNGKDAIGAAEAVLDPATPAGQGIQLNAADGKFDSALEQLSGTLPATAASNDMVYLRSKDAKGNWGPLTAQWINQPTILENTPKGTK